MVRLADAGDEAEVASLIAGFRDYYDEPEPTDEQIASMLAKLIGDQHTEFLLAGEPPIGVAQIRFRPSVTSAS